MGPSRATTRSTLTPRCRRIPPRPPEAPCLPLSARATEIGVFGPNRQIETTTFVANLPALAVAMSVCVTYIGGGPHGYLTVTGGRKPPDAGTTIRGGNGFPSPSRKEAWLPALVPGAMRREYASSKSCPRRSRPRCSGSQDPGFGLAIEHLE